MLSVLFPSVQRENISGRKRMGGAVWASFKVNTLRMSLFLILLQLPA
jgi:hypothetical protein